MTEAKLFTCGNRREKRSNSATQIIWHCRIGPTNMFARSGVPWCVSQDPVPTDWKRKGTDEQRSKTLSFFLNLVMAEGRSCQLCFPGLYGSAGGENRSVQFFEEI
jgi:hypothetical protein